jgi:hypothetical protein
MSKRKFGINSDDYVDVPLPPITRDQLAALQHVQDALPADLKYLAPLLESIRQAYEAALPKIPVKVRN